MSKENVPVSAKARGFCGFVKGLKKEGDSTSRAKGFVTLGDSLCLLLKTPTDRMCSRSFS